MGHSRTWRDQASRIEIGIPTFPFRVEISYKFCITSNASTTEGFPFFKINSVLLMAIADCQQNSSVVIFSHSGLIQISSLVASMQLEAIPIEWFSSLGSQRVNETVQSQRIPPISPSDSWVISELIRINQPQRIFVAVVIKHPKYESLSLLRSLKFNADWDIF